MRRTATRIPAVLSALAALLPCAAARGQTGWPAPLPVYRGTGAVSHRIHSSVRSPAGRRVAILDDRGELTVWEAGCARRLARFASGEPRGPTHTHDGAPMAFSPDGELLALGGSDGRVRVWHAANGALLFTGDHSPEGTRHQRPEWEGRAKVGRMPLTAVAFAPDGERLVTLSSLGSVAVWSTRTHELQRLLWLDRRAFPYHLDVSPDGRTVAVTGAGVHLLSLETGAQTQLAAPLMPDTASAFGVRFSPGGSVLAVSHLGREVHLYAVATRERMHTLSFGEPATALGRFLTFSPDGRSVTALSGSGVAHVWSVASGVLVEAHQMPVATRSLWFTADGRRLVASGYHDRRLRARAVESAFGPLRPAAHTPVDWDATAPSCAPRARRTR